MLVAWEGGGHHDGAELHRVVAAARESAMDEKQSALAAAVETAKAVGAAAVDAAKRVTKKSYKKVMKKLRPKKVMILSYENY